MGSATFRALKTFGTLTAIVLFSTGAFAQTLEVLGPRGAAPPEGFLVALSRKDARGVRVSVDDARVEASGGTLRPAPPAPPLKPFLVVPEPGARSVTVKAQAGAQKVERTFKLGPPASRVSLSLEGKPPVKGVDTSAQLRVKLLGEDGTPDAQSPPPVLQTNVGEISKVERLGPGDYRATYLLPETRYPEVAVIVAFAPWPHPSAIHGAVGSLLVPLSSSIDLPGRTERNARMSIEIAGVNFGPVQAGADGRFSLPVVVPPGHRFGNGVAQDAAGNKRRSKIDLMLPPTDQLACVMNPDRLPADGVARARIVCATSDPYGAPTKSARIELSASSGRTTERHTLGDGVYEWIYSAPSALSARPVKIQASWREGRNVSRDELELTLLPPAAQKAEVELAQDLVHFGGQVELTGQVKDGFGRPREGATVVVDVPLGAASVTQEKEGRFRALWTLPAEGQTGPSELTVRAFGPPGEAPADISAWAEDGAVFVALRDLAGWPVPAQKVLVDGQPLDSGPDGVARVGALAPGEHEVRDATWPGLADTLYVLENGTLWPAGARPGAVVKVPLVLAPPSPVNVRVQVSGRQVTYWVEDPKGKILPGRKVALDVEGAPQKILREAQGKTTVLLEGKGPAQVSVSDLETGVTALAEVPK